MEKSAEVMKSMQMLVRVPEINATSRELSKEMMKVSTEAVYKWFGVYFFVVLGLHVATMLSYCMEICHLVILLSLY